MRIIDKAEAILATGMHDADASAYIMLGMLTDGRVCGLLRLMFHFTMHVGISSCGYEQRYCVDTQEHGIFDMLTWQGEGHPEFWHRFVGGSRAENLRRTTDGTVYPDGAPVPDGKEAVFT